MYIFRKFIDIENCFIKRRNVEKYEKENKSNKEFDGNQEFMKYFNEYEKNGLAALGFENSEQSPNQAKQSWAFHLTALYTQKYRFTELVDAHLKCTQTYQPLLDVDEIITILKPVLLISKSNSINQVSDSLKRSQNNDPLSEEDIRALGQIFTTDSGQQYLEI